MLMAVDTSQFNTLVILGADPVHNATDDVNWANAQRKAKTLVRLGYYEDETSGLCDWHVPLAHYLESWGDARTSDGTLVAIQPLIAPLFNGMTELELLARICGLATASAYEIVRETYRSLPGSGEDEWKKFLHDGFQPG